MVKLFYLVLITIMSISTDVLSDNDIGYKYYQKGNYEKALKIWTVEAEEGNKEAIYNIGLLYFSYTSSTFCKKSWGLLFK